MRKLIIGVAASIGAVVLLGSAFAPVLCRSTETANRVKCASNLRQIGEAISLYARDNGGTLPDSFISLGKAGDLVPEVFLCPSSNSERADSIDRLFTDPKGRHCDYTYVGDGVQSSQLNENVVLAYEDLDDHDRDGIDILFGDGHVDFWQVNRKTPQTWYVEMTGKAASATTRPISLH